MSELVEKVARAIYNTSPHYRVRWNTDKIEWNDLPADNPYTQDGYIEKARASIAAVLDALQDPSEGMKVKGRNVIHVADDQDLYPNEWEIWQAMLAKFREEQEL